MEAVALAMPTRHSEGRTEAAWSSSTPVVLPGHDGRGEVVSPPLALADPAVCQEEVWSVVTPPSASSAPVAVISQPRRKLAIRARSSQYVVTCLLLSSLSLLGVLIWLIQLVRMCCARR